MPLLVFKGRSGFLEQGATPNAYREFAQVSSFPPKPGEFEQAIKEWREGQQGFVVQGFALGGGAHERLDADLSSIAGGLRGVAASQ